MRGGMTHRPTGLSPGLGEFLDFDGADVRALVGDGEGTAELEGFLGDGVIGPGLDGGIRDVILRVEQGDGLRLGVVEQEFDFERAFHGETPFSVAMRERQRGRGDACAIPAVRVQQLNSSVASCLGDLARDHRRVLEALDVADIVRLQGAEALADGEQILVADGRVDGAERARRVLDRTRVRRAVLHLDFEGGRDVRALRSHDDSPFDFQWQK